MTRRIPIVLMLLALLARARAGSGPDRVTIDLTRTPRIHVPVPETIRGEAVRGAWVTRLPVGRPESDGEPARSRGGTPSATVSGGLVYVGGGYDSRRLVALSAESGKLVFATDLEDNGPSPVAADRQSVVTNTESCTTYRFEPLTGSVVWSRWLGPSIEAAPTLDGDRVYVAHRMQDNTYRLSALDLETGATIWQAELERDILGAPIVAFGRIYVTTDCRKAVCFARDGRRLWMRDVEATSAPWVDEGGLTFAVTTRGRADLVRVNPLNGEILWKTTAPKVPIATEPLTATEVSRVPEPRLGGWCDDPPRPVVVGRHVLLACGRQLLFFEDRTGDLVREYLLPFGQRFHAPPAVLGDRLLYSTVSGLLVEVEPRRGTVRPVMDLGVPVTSQPVVAGGKLYLTTDDRVIALPWGEKGGPEWPQWSGSADRMAR